MNPLNIEFFTNLLGAVDNINREIDTRAVVVLIFISSSVIRVEPI